MSAFELAQEFSSVSNKLRSEFEANPELYETNDIESITRDGWLIKYAIFIAKLKEEDAIRMILNVMKWRKTKKFANKTDSDFPSELYKIGAAFAYNQDKDGNLVLFLRIDRKLSLISKLGQQFLLHQLDAIDKRANGNCRWIVVVDYSDVRLASTDLPLVYYLMKVIKHFPVCRYIIHYNANTLINKMIKYTHRKMIDKFAHNKQIFDHFHDAFLPQYLGGTCPQSMSTAPSDAVSIQECYDKLGFNKKTALKYKQKLDKIIADQTNGVH